MYAQHRGPNSSMPRAYLYSLSPCRARQSGRSDEAHLGTESRRHRRTRWYAISLTVVIRFLHLLVLHNVTLTLIHDIAAPAGMCVLKRILISDFFSPKHYFILFFFLSLLLPLSHTLLVCACFN